MQRFMFKMLKITAAFFIFLLIAFKCIPQADAASILDLFRPQSASDCYAKITVEVRDRDNNVIQNNDGFAAQSYVQNPKRNSFQKIYSTDTQQANFTWRTSSIPLDLRNTMSSVELVKLPPGYKISEYFCESHDGLNSCDSVWAYENFTISGLILQCGRSYTYGWKVYEERYSPDGKIEPTSSLSCPIGGPECKMNMYYPTFDNTSVIVSTVVSDQCRNRFSRNTRFNIEVFNDKSQLVCSRFSLGTGDGCIVGRDNNNGLVEKSSQEWKDRKWIDGSTYKINTSVIELTANKEILCSGPVRNVSGVKELSKPTPILSYTPTPEPVCELTSPRCRIQSLQGEIDKDFLNVTFDAQLCTQYPKYYLDVFNDRGQLVCATQYYGSGYHCQLGVDRENGQGLVDQRAEEVISHQWIAGRTYTATVTLHDKLADTKAKKCVSKSESIKLVAPTVPTISQPTPSPIQVSPSISPVPKTGERKILAIIYDTHLKTQGLRSVFDVIKPVFDLKMFAPTVADLINVPTNPSIYRVVDTVEYNKIPEMNKEVEDPVGFENDLLRCYYKPYEQSQDDNEFCKRSKKKYEVSYAALFKELNICDRINKGEIDEVWQVAAPIYNIGEDDMVGPKPFFINGRSEFIPECKRNVPILSIDTTRLPQLAVHSFGHRVESTMTHIFGQDSLWGLFWRANNSPEKPTGCGNIHFTPESTIDYEYGEGIVQNQVDSYCGEFAQYPVVDTNKVNPIMCSAWGCSERGYYQWWLSQLPYKDGTDANGKETNWWKYINDPDFVAAHSVFSDFIHADADHDGSLSALDMSVVIGNFGKEQGDIGQLNVDQNKTTLDGDVNEDGVVNTFDMSYMLDSYGETMSEIQK